MSKSNVLGSKGANGLGGFPIDEQAYDPFPFPNSLGIRYSFHYESILMDSFLFTHLFYLLLELYICMFVVLIYLLNKKSCFPMNRQQRRVWD